MVPCYLRFTSEARQVSTINVDQRSKLRALYNFTANSLNSKLSEQDIVSIYVKQQQRQTARQTDCRYPAPAFLPLGLPLPPAPLPLVFAPAVSFFAPARRAPISVCLFSCAHCRGVFPLTSLVVMSAPWFGCRRYENTCCGGNMYVRRGVRHFSWSVYCRIVLRRNAWIGILLCW